MRRDLALFMLITSILTGCSKETLKTLNVGKVEFAVSNSYDFSAASAGVYVNEVIEYPLTGKFEVPVVYNMHYTYNDGVMNGDNLYLDKSKIFNINAYAPYMPTGDSKSHYLPFNHGTDVLWAQASFPVEGQDTLNMVNLEFRHMTTQVVFELEDKRDELSKGRYDFEKAEYSISGFSKRCFLDVSTGELIRGEIDPSIIITKNDSLTCFAPGEGMSDYNIVLSIPAKEESDASVQVIRSNFSYLFKPGYSYTITISVYTTEISISVNVAEWVVHQTDKLEL